MKQPKNMLFPDCYMYPVTIGLVFYTMFSGYTTLQGGCPGAVSFIPERQYIEQSTDNQQDQSAVNRTELQQ